MVDDKRTTGSPARETEGVSRAPDWDQTSHQEVVRWTPDDLDRCEHGRHSIDHCFDCTKPTNRFLMAPSTVPVDERVRHHGGVWEARIGTMVHGEPIWVVVRDRPREESQMTEQEADGKLPCGSCGHRVRPARHSEAECAKFQMEDATENDRETETDGQ